MRWEFRSFAELDTHELLALLKLRVDVFVVEQACAYAEIDAHDNAPATLHLLGFDTQASVEQVSVEHASVEQGSDDGGHDDTLVAYCRLMPDAARQEVRIGRVVVAESCRGRGLARCMMLQLMRRVSDWNHDLVLSAQTSVIDFYASLGCVVESDEYVEDGIPHVDMRRRRELP